jgi:hypothetical protein
MYFRDAEGVDVQFGIDKADLQGVPTDVLKVYLMNKDGDVSQVRHSVETLVKSLNIWLADPLNGAYMGEMYRKGDRVNARCSKEFDVMFDGEDL